MIPSLRYLCLEKVIAQDEDYADLPEILVKDINLMKVFNGTYCLGDFWETTMVKIFYDGKVWSFKSRTWYHESDGEGEDEAGVCYCKYCFDTTGSNPIDFKVKEGEALKTESSYLDFLGISPLEQEGRNRSGWTFKADLQSNDDKHPFLVENYGDVKSLGVITFYGLGPGGESTVCGRFQVEVVNTPEKEGWFGQIPSKEWKYLHREDTGELYSKDDDDGFERSHVSWWRDPTSGEIFSGVSSFYRVSTNYDNVPRSFYDDNREDGSLPTNESDYIEDDNVAWDTDNKRAEEDNSEENNSEENNSTEDSSGEDNSEEDNSGEVNSKEVSSGEDNNREDASPGWGYCCLM